MKHIELDNPTEQQIVDAAFVHMANMESRCAENNHCLYRSKDGASACAVGAFIPDGHPALNESMGIADLLESVYPQESETPLPAWMYKHVDLLKVLQSVHDSEMAPDLWFADYDLTVPTLTTGFLAKANECAGE